MKFKDFDKELKESRRQDPTNEHMIARVTAQLILNAVIATSKQKLLLANKEEEKIIKDFINSLGIELKRKKVESFGVNVRDFVIKASKK